MTTTTRSVVTEVPAAAPSVALAHFQHLLAVETDCADVNTALAAGADDFILLDVRSPAAYAAGHVDGAVNLPTNDIDAEALASWDPAVTLVVYCAGPHCNGADKAAIRIAALGRPVKKMIGGVTGWLDEGLTLTPSS